MGDSVNQCKVNWELLRKECGSEFIEGDCTVTELNGGYLNYTYRITSKKDTSAIVKQSLENVKISPEAIMPSCRNRIEFYTLSKLEEYAPGSVPKPYFVDVDNAYFVMEDLRDYTQLRDLMRPNQPYKIRLSHCQDVIRYIAKLHRLTHKNNTSKDEHESMIEETRNEIFKAFMINFILNDYRSPRYRTRYSPELLKMSGEHQADPLTAEQDQKLRKAAARQDCLIHGDLHVNAILVKDKTVKLLDLETAGVSVAGTDIGNFLCNYIIAFQETRLAPEKSADPTTSATLKASIDHIVEAYFADAKEYLTPDQFAATVSDTAGFAGAGLRRRILGYNDEGLDDVDHSLYDIPTLRLAFALLRDFDKITTPEQLLKYIYDKY